MLYNACTKIIGKNVILVPYKKQHVVKYHNWMKSEELQQLTASEPLTLEQEYKMQQSWLMDDDKCTFIILNKQLFDSTNDEIESMIGDTNLFLQSTEEVKQAEAEIMIAETWARRKHCGWEAMLLMLLYGIQSLAINKYIAKISFENEKSNAMFKKMGFSESSRSEVFQEITLEKLVDPTWIQWLSSIVQFEIILENKEKCDQ